MKYEVFICYKQNTAKDYALHLWEGLQEYQHTAFLDCKDIPTRFSEGTEKWRAYRNAAITNCEIFLMIITRGFENSPEIQNEIELAIKQKKEFMCFRHTNLPANIIVRPLANLGEYQQITFETSEGLLREVLYNLERALAIPLAPSMPAPIRQTPEIEQTHRYPLVHFYVTQQVQNNPKLKRKLPNVGFNIRNLGNSPVKARIKARVFLDSKSLGLVKGGGYYNARTLWNLNPNVIIFGNFNIPKSAAESSARLRIKICATLFDTAGIGYTLLPVSWTFKRDKNDWILEPTGDQ